tara:strand:- start:358 stop:1065 length:708 start_codon:yes stop_codon:yes gene_type:complete
MATKSEIEKQYHAVADYAEQDMGSEILFKSDSAFMRFLSKVIFWMPTEQFMDGYTTTIGKTIYLSDRYAKRAEPSTAEIGTIAHELVHVEQFDRLGLFGMSLAYLFPQWLAALSLLSILAVFNLWFLLCLGFLVFAAPIPAPWRMIYEVEAYATGYATWHWVEGNECPALTPEQVDQLLSGYVMQFTGWSYYKMWPWKKDIQERLSEKLGCLNRGEWSELPQTAKAIYERTLGAK